MVTRLLGVKGKCVKSAEAEQKGFSSQRAVRVEWQLELELQHKKTTQESVTTQ